MSRTLEIPDDLYERLEKAAARIGKTPQVWLDLFLPSLAALNPAVREGSLYDQVKDLIGCFDSGGIENMKEDPNDPLFNIPLQKKRDGTL
jgi:hypothetical protein